MIAHAMPREHAVPTDEDLARRAADGDRASFGLLVERYQAPIYSYLLQIVRDPDCAGDLAQDTFVRAWCRLDRFDPARRFRPWLYTVATNLSRNHFRGMARFRRACQTLQVRLDWSTEEPGPRETCRADREEQAVREAVNGLPGQYRAIVWLRYFEELSSQEIADVVGLTASAVDMRLSRARKLLRKRLAHLAPEDAGAPFEVVQR